MACQGDSEPSLGRVHWWPNRADNAKATGSLPPVATKEFQESKRNLSNECLITAEQRLVLLAATLYLGLVPDRDPDFLLVDLCTYIFSEILLFSLKLDGC